MRLGSEIWPLYAQQACTVFRTAGKASGECYVFLSNEMLNTISILFLFRALDLSSEY